MTKRLVRILAVAVSCMAFNIALAQSPRTDHTYKLDDPDSRPPATLADAAMLVGSWTGTAFGGTIEETWNPPSAGSMVGLFKLMHDDAVSLYEIMLIAEEEGTINLKVKHFNADFSAWEDKEDYTNFRFIKAEVDAIHFSGISFYKVSEDELNAYLVMRNGDEIREEKIVYRRSGENRHRADRGSLGLNDMWQFRM
jgi:hypothetical protein